MIKMAEAKKSKSYKLWKLFGKEGDRLVRKNKNCPKCGQGFFLAAHKNRLVCGKCNYAEFLSKK